MIGNGYFQPLPHLNCAAIPRTNTFKSLLTGQAAWPSASQLGRSRLTQGLGLDEVTVREIYEAVGWEAATAGVGDDDRMAEVRKRMLAAARGA